MDVVEERPGEHPPQVTGVARGDLGEWLVEELPERENDAARVVSAEPTGHVHLDQRGVEFGRGGRQRVPPDLPVEYLGRRSDVGDRGVSGPRGPFRGTSRWRWPGSAGDAAGTGPRRR